MISRLDNTLLPAYRRQLEILRCEWGGVYSLPDVSFFLFGMGERRKLLYRAGVLSDALSGEVLQRWEVKSESIIPPAYAVAVEKTSGERVVLREDGRAVWLEEGGAHQALTESEPVNLPTFDGHPYGLVLRVLHQEILVNIKAGLPLPNYFVYSKPWYRDGAMMALVLRETGNLHLLADWVNSLSDPYDYNNGSAEPDNLGQALFLIALCAGADHPLVARILAEAGQFETGDYLNGITDYGLHPVYQTQWMKLGLSALGLPDPYRVPDISDSYAALCWWGEKRTPVDAGRMVSGDYPYLTWGSDITFTEHLGMIGDCDYPLTWEANASAADYAGMERISPEFTQRKLAAPHTWHATEMFFRLLGQRSFSRNGRTLER